MGSKYDLLEENLYIANYNEIIKPPEVVPPPLNISLRTIPIVNDGVTSYSLVINWERPLKSNGTPETFVTSYFVEFAREGDTYGSRQEVLENTSRVARYENVGTGSFKVRVASVMAINNKVSAWEEMLESINFFPISLQLDYTSPDSFWFD